ncbi:hypothetical protein [Bacillus sp. UNC437CL72CviS29]|uniref:hypothetical protein n=1 Tax=Bacillus sp. UNC437CL72CviS29 TaxID=1340430 RepID=UPI00047AD155|nr:hypothetical protein [Bacillus sp. UNC437CL72CviS29]
MNKIVIYIVYVKRASDIGAPRKKIPMPLSLLVYIDYLYASFIVNVKVEITEVKYVYKKENYIKVLFQELVLLFI